MIAGPEEDSPEDIMRTPVAMLGYLTVMQMVGHKLTPMTYSDRYWADELGDSVTPRTYLEDFYVLMAMQLGDPEVGVWLQTNSVAFREAYELFVRHRKVPVDDPRAILLSYIIWYSRYKPS